MVGAGISRCSLCVSSIPYGHSAAGVDGNVWSSRSDDCGSASRVGWPSLAWIEVRGVIRAGLYEHYKGQRYEVLGLARHSETEEELVVYRALYGEKGLWVRPYGMFVEEVVVEGQAIPRFRFVG